MNNENKQIELSSEFKNETGELSFTLKPSSIAGVGVFAAHNIKKGTRLKLFPDGHTRFISNKELKSNKELCQFCSFFGVETKEGTIIPVNFSQMSIGWYLNHSENNNAIHDVSYRYFANRDIKAGEEILINYKDL